MERFSIDARAPKLADYKSIEIRANPEKNHLVDDDPIIIELAPPLMFYQISEWIFAFIGAATTRPKMGLPAS